jgi:hypothetical protein
MKFKNLRRDPRCSLLISHADWWSGFLVFEGRAELIHSGNTGPEALRSARRYIYSATTRRRSADWDEYDRITETDERVAMILRPEHVYGTALTRMREALKKWSSAFLAASGAFALHLDNVLRRGACPDERLDSSDPSRVRGRGVRPRHHPTALA